MLVHPRHLPASIATRRAHLGLTQAELADSLSVSRQFLALMESGERTPSVAMLCKLCEALGCAPADLLTGGE